MTRERLRSLAKRLRRRLNTGVHQPVTVFGLVYSLAIVLVGAAAFLSGNNLVFLILSVMFATMLVSGFISRLSLAALRLELLLPEHIAARRTVQARVILGNEKWLMPSFSIHLARLTDEKREPIVYVPLIPGRSSVEAPLDLWFPRRGTERDNRFLFSTRFPFGFAERRIEVEVKHEFLIYPCLDSQPGFEELLAAVHGEIDSRFRGNGEEFYHIRPYQSGDSARLVDWKASAHTGELQVREFAREENRAVDLLLDLDTGRQTADWFERAVDCAAFLCWRLSNEGIAIRLRTQNVELRLPEQTDVYGMLKYLALVTPVAGRLSPGVHDPRTFQIIFSAEPPRFAAVGSLDGVRVLGPLDLPRVGGTDTAGSPSSTTTAARARAH